jgi:hypothetical protein
VPDRLAGQRLMDLRVEGQQGGGDRHAEEEHASGAGKGPEHMQTQ